MALAILYLYTVSICAQLTHNRGPVWLHLFVMLFIWNALKMAWIVPTSLVPMLRTRGAESRSAG